MFEKGGAVSRSQSCRLGRRSVGLMTTSLVLASFGSLTVAAPSATASPRPGLVTAAARHLSSAASCPGGVSNGDHRRLLRGPVGHEHHRGRVSPIISRATAPPIPA